MTSLQVVRSGSGLDCSKELLQQHHHHAMLSSKQANPCTGPMIGSAGGGGGTLAEHPDGILRWRRCEERLDPPRASALATLMMMPPKRHRKSNSSCSSCSSTPPASPNITTKSKRSKKPKSPKPKSSLVPPRRRPSRCSTRSMASSTNSSCGSSTVVYGTKIHSGVTAAAAAAAGKGARIPMSSTSSSCDDGYLCGTGYSPRFNQRRQHPRQNRPRRQHPHQRRRRHQDGAQEEEQPLKYFEALPPPPPPPTSSSGVIRKRFERDVQLAFNISFSGSISSLDASVVSSAYLYGAEDEDDDDDGYEDFEDVTISDVEDDGFGGHDDEVEAFDASMVARCNYYEEKDEEYEAVHDDMMAESGHSDEKLVPVDLGKCQEDDEGDTINSDPQNPDVPAAMVREEDEVTTMEDDPAVEAVAAHPGTDAVSALSGVTSVAETALSQDDQPEPTDTSRWEADISSSWRSESLFPLATTSPSGHRIPRRSSMDEIKSPHHRMDLYQRRQSSSARSKSFDAASWHLPDPDDVPGNKNVVSSPEPVTLRGGTGGKPPIMLGHRSMMTPPSTVTPSSSKQNVLDISRRSCDTLPMIPLRHWGNDDDQDDDCDDISCCSPDIDDPL